MGNCLKTQLKEVVQNSNLVKMGQLMFKSSSNMGIGDNYWFGIRPVNQSLGETSISVNIIPVSGNVYVGTDAKPQNPIVGAYTVTTTEKVSVRNFNVWMDANSSFIIETWYDLALIFNAATIKPIDVKYLTAPQWVCLADGSLSSLDLTKAAPLKRLQFGKNLITDIPLSTLFAAMTAPERLYLSNNKQAVTMTQLGQSLANTIAVIEIYGTTISGTIEDYVAAQRLKYPTGSGHVYFNFVGSYDIRYQGVKVSSPCTLDWDANNITIS